MKSKVFYGVMAVLVISFVGLIFTKTLNKESQQPSPGIAHEDLGREHVQAKTYGGDEPPTSGPHATALPWGSYDREIADANTIHNLEHGGIYISYRPDLPKNDIEKIKALFIKPFSNPDFKPNKVIIAPRANNKSSIVMSSWNKSEQFASYNQQLMIDYHLKNFGNSPESGAL